MRRHAGLIVYALVAGSAAAIVVAQDWVDAAFANVALGVAAALVVALPFVPFADRS